MALFGNMPDCMRKSARDFEETLGRTAMFGVFKRSLILRFCVAALVTLTAIDASSAVGPTPISPGTASSPGTQISTLTNVLFSWSGGSGAVAWQLNIRNVTNSASGPIVYTSPNIATGFTSAMISAPNLVAGNSYKWNVFACTDATCNVGSGGTPFYFTTAPSAVPVAITLRRYLDGNLTNNVPITVTTDLNLRTQFSANTIAGDSTTYPLYNPGTNVTLIASALSGATFQKWSSCPPTVDTLTTNTTHTLTINSEIARCVHYLSIPTSNSVEVYSTSDGSLSSGATVTLSPPPTSGGGSLTPIQPPNEAHYALTTNAVNVTAGSWGQRRFTGWNMGSGPTCTNGVVSNATCGLSMATSRSVTATYATQTTYSLFATVDGVATSVPGFLRTASNTAGVASSTTSSPQATTTFTAPSANTVIESYDLGQYVKLVAPATANGRSFTQWAGPSCTEGNNTTLSCTIQMTSSGQGYEARYGSQTPSNTLNYSISGNSSNRYAKLYPNATCTGVATSTSFLGAGSFTALPNGSYCVEAWNTNNLFAPSSTEEYWGRTVVTLTGGTTSVVISRTEPTANTFLFLNSSGQPIGAGSTPVGTPVTARITVSLPTQTPATQRGVQVQFDFRTLGGSVVQKTCVTPISNVPSGSSVVVECTFTPDVVGTWQRQVKLLDNVTGGNPSVVTDSWEFSPTDVLSVTPPASTALTISPVDLEVNYQAVTPFPVGAIDTLRGQRVRLRVRVTDNNSANVSSATVTVYRLGWLVNTPDMATVEVAGNPGLYDVYFYVPTSQLYAPLGQQQNILIQATKSGFTQGQWSKPIAVNPPPYGVTIVIHGFQATGDGNQLSGCQQYNELVEKIGSAVLQRKGSGYRHTYDHSDGRLLRRDTLSPGSQVTSDGEWIFEVNWSCASNDQTPGHAEAAAQALWATLKTYNVGSTSHSDPTSGVWSRTIAEGRSVHIIAHSFGAAVAQQLMRRLVSPNFEGITNVHVTTLDPHEWQQTETPVDETTLLPNVDYSGALFSAVRRENYYQRETIGVIVPAGRCIPSAYNLRHYGLSVAPSFVTQSHTGVWRRYLHTILPDQESIASPAGTDSNWTGEWATNTEKWSEGYRYSGAMKNVPPNFTNCTDPTYESEASTDVQVMGALGGNAERYPFDQYRVFDGGFSSDLDDSLHSSYLFTDRAGYRGGTAVQRSTASGIALAFNRSDSGRKIETNNTFVPSDVLSVRAKLKAHQVLVDADTFGPTFVAPGTSYPHNGSTAIAPNPIGNVKVGLFVPTPTNPWAGYESLGVETGNGIYLKNISAGSTQFCYPLPVSAQGGRLINLSVEVENTGGANGLYYVDDLELSTQLCPTTSRSLTVYSQASGVPSSNVPIALSGLVTTSVVTNVAPPAFVLVTSVGSITAIAPATDSTGKIFVSWSDCDFVDVAARSCRVDFPQSASGSHRGVTVSYANPVQNGACGTANGAVLFTTPAANLCLSGVANPVSGSGPWNWSCVGTNGGSTASCTAQLADTTPDAFTFTAALGVALNSTIASNTVTITGINTAAPISVVGGSYSIGCNGTFSASSATISNNQTVCVRHTSSATNSTSVTTTLTVGATQSTFQSVTVSGASVNGACGGANGGVFSIAPTTNLCAAGVASPLSGSGPWSWTCVGSNGGSTSSCSAQFAGTTPNAFTFLTQNNVPLGTEVTSNTVTISGITAAVPISVAGGSYSIGCSATFTNNPATISNNQTVCVRHTSSAVPLTSATTTLVVGGTQGTFQSVTGNGTADATPPTAPTALSVGYSTTSTVGLNWVASDDSGGSGLAGYKVERCAGSGCGNFAQIAMPATNSFGDTGLAASTIYSYRVRAYDNAGNTSDYSNVIAVTTSGNAVTGACGASNGQTFATAPTVGLCAVGTPSSVTGSGPWFWSCAGSGTVASQCFAQRPTSPTCDGSGYALNAQWMRYGTASISGNTITVGDTIGYDPNDSDGDCNPAQVWGTGSAGAPGGDQDQIVTTTKFSSGVRMAWDGCVGRTSLSYVGVGLALHNPSFTAAPASQQGPTLGLWDIGFYTRWENANSLLVRSNNDTDTVVPNATLSANGYCGLFEVSIDGTQHIAKFNGNVVYTGTAVASAASPRVGFATTWEVPHTMTNVAFGPVVACGLDANGDGATTAGLDGILLSRYLFGVRGAALIADVPLGQARPDASAVQSFLGDALQFDVVGRTTAAPTALVDGLILTRLMLGVPDSVLLNGIAIPATAQFRDAAAIRSNVNFKCGMTF